MIRYRSGEIPSARAIASLYEDARLPRPAHDQDRLRRMYEASNVIHTAWMGERLVGILRGWTDGVFEGYVCDLAVHPDVHGQGVGRELLRMALGQDPHIQWSLRADAASREFYAHLGWERLEHGWVWPRQEP